MIRRLRSYTLDRLLIGLGWAGMLLAGLGIAWPLAALGLPLLLALIAGGVATYLCDQAALAVFDELSRRR